MTDSPLDKEDEKKCYVKKPLNAFMLYMREERPKVVAQCKVKESATINQILGQRVRLIYEPVFHLINCDPSHCYIHSFTKPTSKTLSVSVCLHF